GVKPWQFDPTKWCIWLLHQVALVRQLRRVSEEKIMLAQVAEQHRQISAKLGTRPTHAQESLQRMLHTAQARLQHASSEWARRKAEYRQAADLRVQASKDSLIELRRELREAGIRLRMAWREWQNAQ